MNDQASPPLEEIVFEFEKTTPIAHDAVKRWMETEDIEAMGALMALLADEKHFQRIAPPLTFQEYFPFAACYYGRSIRENPNGEWSDSRTTAGGDFARWFNQLWESRSTYDAEIQYLKSLLKTLYEGGSPEFRSAFVTSILEHLFEKPDIANYFADWEIQPLLNPAYVEAKLLANLQHQRRDRDTTSDQTSP